MYNMYILVVSNECGAGECGAGFSRVPIRMLIGSIKSSTVVGLPVNESLDRPC